MVKLLFCGDIVGNNWPLLVDRVKSLQKSAHGPFDALLLVGKCFHSEAEFNDVLDKYIPNIPSSLKMYSFDYHSYIEGYSLPPNLVVINSSSISSYCGILTIDHNLTISYISRITDDKNNKLVDTNGYQQALEKVKSIVSSPGYRGCDALISKEWPKDMHHFMDSSELVEYRATNIGIGAGSKAVASFACLVQPRYHFVSGVGSYFQRSPYSNKPKASSSGVISNSSSSSSSSSSFTRLTSLDSVSTSKDKAKKWMHALSINPIINLSNAELYELPPGTTECPYIETGVAISNSTSNTSAGDRWKHSLDTSNQEYQANKRVKVDDPLPGIVKPPLPPGPAPPPPPSASSGSYFFGTMGVASSSSGGGGYSNCGVNLAAPSSQACTLFIGGLLRSMTESDLEGVLNDVLCIKRPPGKSFAFVEFTSHAAALKAVEISAR